VFVTVFVTASQAVKLVGGSGKRAAKAQCLFTDGHKYLGDEEGIGFDRVFACCASLHHDVHR
jgi:hypothetical protein